MINILRDSTTHTDFFNILKEIIKANNVSSIKDLCNLFSVHTNTGYTNYKGYKNYYINATIHNNVTLLYSPHIAFNIGELDMTNQLIMNNLNSCIIDNHTLKPLFNINVRFNYNKTFFESTSKKNIQIKHIIDNLDYLDEKDKIEFYPNYDGEYIVLFYDNINWNILHNNIIRIYNEVNSNDTPLVFKLFKNLFEENCSIDILEKNISYHFELIHHRLVKCIYDMKYGSDIRDIKHIHSIDNKTLLRVDKNINIKKYNRIYLSCKDELLAYIEKINREMKYEGKLTQKGIFMIYYDPNSNTSFEINFDTDIYTYISSKIKPYKNIHHAYLMMYIHNECKTCLSFITENHWDIIKRINNSLKTISTELLEIYFITAEKQNPELYEALPRIYRDIKFAIHGIYIKKRKNDMIKGTNSDNDNDNDNDINFTSSIELNDVYTYLKTELGDDNIIELYSQRLVLINLINNEHKLKKYKKLNIFNLDCSNTIIQTELMLNTY